MWASGDAFGKSKVVLDQKVKCLKDMEGLELLLCKEGNLAAVTILNYFEFEIIEDKELMGPRNS